MAPEERSLYLSVSAQLIAKAIAGQGEEGREAKALFDKGGALAALNRPLTTALEREMGLDPRVPEEVSEVAEDIRRDLAKLRKAHSLVG